MINAKEALELTLNSITEHEDSKRKYIMGMIKSTATSRKYSIEFDYMSEYRPDDEDVVELKKLGFKIIERYKNGTSIIVSWKPETK
jgi:hypothetical protein